MSAEVERIILRIVLCVIMALSLYVFYERYKANEAQLAQAQETIRQYQVRDQVSQQLDRSYDAQIASQTTTQKVVETHRIIVEKQIDALAKKDPTVADYLSTPIPDSLRQADRQFGVSGGLGPSAAASSAANPAD